jgi:Uma2 family endonuclease
LVVEIISPDDETYAKLPFYADHEVDEVLIVDPSAQGVEWLGLRPDGEYDAIERSALIDCGPAELGAHINLPQ